MIGIDLLSKLNANSNQNVQVHLEQNSKIVAERNVLAYQLSKTIKKITVTKAVRIHQVAILHSLL